MINRSNIKDIYIDLIILVIGLSCLYLFFDNYRTIRNDVFSLESTTTIKNGKYQSNFLGTLLALFIGISGSLYGLIGVAKEVFADPVKK